MSRRCGHSLLDLSPVTLHQRIPEQGKLRMRVEQRWVWEGNGTQEMRRQVALGRLETAVPPWTLSALTDTHPASFPVALHSDHLHSIFPPGNVKESILNIKNVSVKKNVARGGKHGIAKPDKNKQTQKPTFQCQEKRPGSHTWRRWSG